jgi:purine-binding chemotaxis protein CheW
MVDKVQEASMAAQETASGQQQYLTFHLASEEYAISILRIKEIIEYDQITKVPRMPGWVRGVINLRGSVVPVIDLAVKFGMEETRISPLCCIIIIELEIDGEPIVMGVIAESVSQVVDLSPVDIQPPPAFGTRLRADFLLGMGTLEKKFALILDIDRILSTEELLATTASVDAATDGVPETSTVQPQKDGVTSVDAG